MKSKNLIARPHVSAHPDIEEVRRRLDAWRQTRQHGERIPEDLWIAAAKLARVHGSHLHLKIGASRPRRPSSHRSYS